jgi:hypothetical protein
MQEGGVSCGQKRLPEKAESSQQTKTFETQRKGGSGRKELLRALVALLASMIRSTYIRRSISWLPPITLFLCVSRVFIPV